MRSTRLTGYFERVHIRYTHSRPHVSDDNAFIESLFATLKGRASFPEYFRTLQEARTYVDGLMAWYNGQHMHSRLDYLTPDQMDRGEGPEVQARRNAVLARARGLKPNRFGTRSLCLRVPKSVKPPSMRSFPTLEPARDILAETRRIGIKYINQLLVKSEIPQKSNW